MTFANALLVCVLCGVGLCTFGKRRTVAKKPWITERGNAAPKGPVPLFTRVYVVRSWQEQTIRGREIVMRYALDIAATGERRGFTRSEALLDTLSTELTRAQEAQSSAK